jgi:hypothetical protein
MSELENRIAAEHKKAVKNILYRFKECGLVKQETFDPAQVFSEVLGYMFNMAIQQNKRGMQRGIEKFIKYILDNIIEVIEKNDGSKEIRSEKAEISWDGNLGIDLVGIDTSKKIKFTLNLKELGVVIVKKKKNIK